MREQDEDLGMDRKCIYTHHHVSSDNNTINPYTTHRFVPTPSQTKPPQSKTLLKHGTYHHQARTGNHPSEPKKNPSTDTHTPTQHFSKSSIIFGLLALLSSHVAADGCQDCGGFDKVNIYNECVAQCDSALEDPGDAKACSEQCSKLVLEENCCTTTVCPSARRRRGLISDRDLLADVSRQTGSTRRSSMGVEFSVEGEEHVEVERSLETRDGRSCCAGCRTLKNIAGICPIEPYSFAISMAA